MNKKDMNRDLEKAKTFIASPLGKIKSVWEKESDAEEGISNDFTSLSDRLSAFAEALSDESGSVENDFLQLGLSLQKNHEDASALIERACETVALVNGEEGLLAQIEYLVNKSLTYQEGYRSRVSQVMTSFSRGAELLETLLRVCRTIDKMALGLQMVGLNIGVEAVRTVEGRELFGVVASDVRELSKKIIGIAEAIQEDAAEALDMQQKANRETSRDADQFATLAAEAGVSLRELVEKIQTLMDASIVAMNQAGDHSREISKWTGTVVERIQFHDSMHQRIGHISEALRETARGLLPNPSGSRAGKLSAQAHAVITLQAAQLKQVIQEVDDAHVATHRAFDEIERHVGALSQNLSEFSSQTDHAAALPMGVDPHPGPPLSSAEPPEGDLFGELGAAAGRFKAIMQEGEDLNERIQKIFDHASVSADQLSDAVKQIRKINIEMHLLALNAIIKAAHMGAKGRALEILAQEVQNLSKLSNEFVGEVGDLLGKILGVAQSSQENKADDTDLHRSEMAAKEAAVIGLHEKLDHAVLDIVERGDAVAKAISGIRKRLSFLAKLKKRLNRRRLELEHLTNNLLSLSEGMDSEGAEALKFRYTMDKERIVHERQVSGARVDQGAIFQDPQAALPPPPQADENLGDNVELF